MKILVLGSKGQLGRCLNDQLDKVDHQCIYTTREQIDISEIEKTKSQICKAKCPITNSRRFYLIKRHRSVFTSSHKNGCRGCRGPNFEVISRDF